MSEYPLKSKYICMVKANAPIQYEAAEISLSGRASTVAWSAPRLFASKTFFPRPTMNLDAPSPKSLRLVSRDLSWFSMSLYFTIGPAMSCGKNER